MCSLIFLFNFQEFNGKELRRRTNALGAVVAKETEELSELRKVQQEQGVELRKFQDEQGVRMDQLWELCMNLETTLSKIEGKLDELVEAVANRAANPEEPLPERRPRDPEVVSTGTFLMAGVYLL